MESDERMNRMLTVKEVARLLHVHPNTLRRWTKNGRIRSYRIAPRGDRRFKYEEIARFLAELNAKAGNWEEDDGQEQTETTMVNETTTMSEEPSLSGARNSGRSKAHTDR